MRYILGIIAILVFGSFNPNRVNYSIEIYLPQNVFANGTTEEFEIKRTDLPVLPFIMDDEIVSFDSSTNQISFEKQAAERIGKLTPSLGKGIPFVLTFDRDPVLTGYFWNVLSSFECKAYVLLNERSPTQVLRKGLPEIAYKDVLIERRKSYFFIQALERTGGLK